MAVILKNGHIGDFVSLDHVSDSHPGEVTEQNDTTHGVFWGYINIILISSLFFGSAILDFTQKYYYLSIKSIYSVSRFHVYYEHVWLANKVIFLYKLKVNIMINKVFQDISVLLMAWYVGRMRGRWQKNAYKIRCVNLWPP